MGVRARLGDNLRAHAGGLSVVRGGKRHGAHSSDLATDPEQVYFDGQLLSAAGTHEVKFELLALREGRRDWHDRPPGRDGQAVLYHAGRPVESPRDQVYLEGLPAFYGPQLRAKHFAFAFRNAQSLAAVQALPAAASAAGLVEEMERGRIRGRRLSRRIRLRCIREGGRLWRRHRRATWRAARGFWMEKGRIEQSIKIDTWMRMKRRIARNIHTKNFFVFSLFIIRRAEYDAMI
jgi:hypothetical protein